MAERPTFSGLEAIYRRECEVDADDDSSIPQFTGLVDYINADACQLLHAPNIVLVHAAIVIAVTSLLNELDHLVLPLARQSSRSICGAEPTTCRLPCRKRRSWLSWRREKPIKDLHRQSLSQLFTATFKVLRSSTMGRSIGIAPIHRVLYTKR